MLYLEVRSGSQNAKALSHNVDLNADIVLVYKDSYKSKKQKEQPEAVAGYFQLESPCTSARLLY